MGGRKKSDIVKETVPASIFDMAERRVFPLLKHMPPRISIAGMMATCYLQGVRDTVLLIEEQKENMSYEI